MMESPFVKATLLLAAIIFGITNIPLGVAILGSDDFDPWAPWLGRDPSEVFDWGRIGIPPLGTRYQTSPVHQGIFDIPVVWNARTAFQLAPPSILKPPIMELAPRSAQFYLDEIFRHLEPIKLPAILPYLDPFLTTPFYSVARLTGFSDPIILTRFHDVRYGNIDSLKLDSFKLVCAVCLLPGFNVDFPRFDFAPRPYDSIPRFDPPRFDSPRVWRGMDPPNIPQFDPRPPPMQPVAPVIQHFPPPVILPPPPMIRP